jgi:ABC-type transport system involved in cytochrome bd biosynthesis fused ATPase/permease subunit
VLKDGKVAEIGSHNELVEKKGVYASLVRAQEFEPVRLVVKLKRKISLF